MFLQELTHMENEILRFKYIVNPAPPPAIAFGTTLHRVTLPLSGPALSSFMRAIQGDADRSPGPAACVDGRNYLMKKTPSVYGYGPMVSNVARSRPLQMQKYGTDFVICETKLVKPNAKPFNSGIERDVQEEFLTPPPNMYDYHKPSPRFEILSAFGTRRKIKHPVALICSPYNSAECCRCGETPIGDYWHSYKTNSDRCRRCLNKVKSHLNCVISQHRRLQILRLLSDYKKIRHCSFCHDHHGTTVAVNTVPMKELKLKFITETYLSLYM
ncbi:uncharacterized protein ACN2A1_001460 [Glossina fuscipes fuscipes]